MMRSPLPKSSVTREIIVDMLQLLNTPNISFEHFEHVYYSLLNIWNMFTSPKYASLLNIWYMFTAPKAASLFNTLINIPKQRYFHLGGQNLSGTNFIG